MKKLLLSLGVFSFVIPSMITAEAQQVYIGARVGGNLANQSDNFLANGLSNGIHAGLLIGVQGELAFGDIWAISVQALYDQKGTKQNFIRSSEGGDTTTTGTVTSNLDYLEIPILLKVCLGTGVVRPYLFAGPSVGMFLSGAGNSNLSTIGKGLPKQIYTSSNNIPNSSVNSPDISIDMGAGISCKLGSGQIVFADASYAYGLTNIAVPSNYNMVSSRDVRLAAGILFPLD